jgi:predicted alpha/beta superfamily hydrolase
MLLRLPAVMYSGRTMACVIRILTILAFLCSSSFPAYPQVASGSPVLRFHALDSKVFGNVRTIRVLVPPDYHNTQNSRRRYPVLYLNDGQNLFDKATSVFNPMEWRVDETVSKLIREGEIPPIIVVGIDNAGRSGRSSEYLPYPDEFLSPPLANPHGKQFPKFLIDEVMPHVARNYRVMSGREHTALGGSSYGGLISLYAYALHPNVFGRLLIESPSLYVSHGKIFDELTPEPASPMRLPFRVYIGVGTNEMNLRECDPKEDGGEAVSDVRKLERLLRVNGMPPSRILVNIESCAVHDEEAWARRLPAAIRFLFAR